MSGDIFPIFLLFWGPPQLLVKGLFALHFVKEIVKKKPSTTPNLSCPTDSSGMAKGWVLRREELPAMSSDAVATGGKPRVRLSPTLIS